MIVAFEGIDGAGKTLASRLLAERLTARGLRAHLLERDSVAFDDAFTDRRLESLRAIIWPHEPEPEVDPLDAQFYLFLLAAWFSALRPYASDILADRFDVVIIDRSYFRVVAKAHLRIGLEIPWLLSLFADALQPDLVILLDIEPALAWQRRHSFRATEIGRWDGFGSDAAQAFCGYQGKVREALRAMAEQRHWPLVSQTEAFGPEALADSIEHAVLGAIKSDPSPLRRG